MKSARIGRQSVRPSATTSDNLVGHAVSRIEDASLLRGRGRFVDDIALPGMLIAAFVRSPHAHASVRRVDTTTASKLPGIHAILTLKDLEKVLRNRRMVRPSNSTTNLDKLWPFALADVEVSYVGEPVAIVVASDRYYAEDAVALVEVEYDVLPSVSDCRIGAEASAPVVRTELSSNVVATFNMGYGEIDKAFATAAHIFGSEIKQCRGGAHSIEGRGIICEYRSADGSLCVFASTQFPHDLKYTLGSHLGLSDSQIRVVTPDVGGGFGAKINVYSEDVAVAASSILLERTIKWTEDRREHFTNAVQERDQIWKLEVAAHSDGKIAGIRGSMLHEQGAYALLDLHLPFNSSSALTGPYMVPAFAITTNVILTNKTPVAAVRGAGYPQAVFAMERLLDLVARELKIDRCEIRRRNLIPGEDMPYKTPLKTRSGAHITYDSGDYPKTQAVALDASKWHDFPSRQRAARRQGRYLGIGIANAVKGTGRGPFESGLVRVDGTGKVTVYTGAAEMGQGLRTVLAQICASEFGISVSAVDVVMGDTAGVPLGMGGFASRQLITAGSAVRLAAQRVAAKAKTLASQILEADEVDLALANGHVHVVGAEGVSVSLAHLARILAGAPGYAFPTNMEPGLDQLVNFRTDSLCYTNTCHVVEVDIDIDTGAVLLLNYTTVQDAGRLINPMIVDGQIIGGVVHGIGSVMFERLVYTDDGQPLATNFADYLLPTATEIPPICTVYTESPTPLNPLGAKGVGEVGTVAAAPAIISAIENALAEFGVHIAEIPITPESVLNAVTAGREARRPYDS